MWTSWYSKEPEPKEPEPTKSEKLVESKEEEVCKALEDNGVGIYRIFGLALVGTQIIEYSFETIVFPTIEWCYGEFNTVVTHEENVIQLHNGGKFIMKDFRFSPTEFITVNKEKIDEGKYFNPGGYTSHFVKGSFKFEKV